MKHVFCVTQSVLLTKFISDNLCLVGMSAIKNQIKMGEVRVNSSKCLADCQLNIGDKVEIFLPQRLESPLSLKIVYEDDNILIVDKPPHAEVETHVINYLKQDRNNVFAVHRLDRNTSGLVIFALNLQSKQILDDAMRQHTVKKYYHALVSNAPPKTQDTISAYLFKDSEKSFCYVSETEKRGYVKIITQYKILGKQGEYTLLEVSPLTGRTHQIRAHLKFIGCPIIGDGKYGDEQINKKSGYKFQQLRAVKLVFGVLPSPLDNIAQREFVVK